MKFYKDKQSRRNKAKQILLFMSSFYVKTTLEKPTPLSVFTFYPVEPNTTLGDIDQRLKQKSKLPEWLTKRIFNCKEKCSGVTTEDESCYDKPGGYIFRKKFPMCRQSMFTNLSKTFAHEGISNDANIEVLPVPCEEQQLATGLQGGIWSGRECAQSEFPWAGSLQQYASSCPSLQSHQCMVSIFPLASSPTNVGPVQAIALTAKHCICDPRTAPAPGSSTLNYESFQNFDTMARRGEIILLHWF